MSGDSRDPEKNRVWSGIYPTWEDACAYAKSIGGMGQSGAEWFARITGQLNEYRQELEQYGIAMPPRPTNLPLLCSMARPNSILDLGGSSGWCWDHICSSGSSESVTEYLIVETPEVVQYMKNGGLQTDPVRYKTLDEPLETIDTVYCNSVLQYFENNKIFISILDRTRPEYILLDDLVAGNHKDFFTVQLFRGSAIPYRFLDLQSLKNSLSMLGYRVVMQNAYPSPIRGVVAPLPMDNFPISNRLRYSSTVLLKRETAK